VPEVFDAGIPEKIDGHKPETVRTEVFDIMKYVKAG
jgi:hypothetical protein